ncbi:hypothetical protein L11322_00272 [Chlamydia trachomatis L1/1322/p2]|uniref:hypothetical protein n=1 Tax=Chlamydia trachomatis TaxID=813 RepID=UPI0002A86C22|nr:hypothetical protein [Chlamydia trachomatis]CCP63188.1 hypothetical protein L11322_00272 [Chlamydia trachomatis L1/1322/p2]CCP64078.1 hypothetical protein L1115_00272 [Chlamydia trachomatis L1/115]CCP64966.1 hypothetical protein L1224_00271 [Chlamydia trachomatis L1/224]CRH23795.1 Uncharacterised protein [Chlamydia trachomatis]
MLVESQLGLEDVLEAFSERNFDIQSKSLIESFQDKKLRRTVIQRFLHHPLLHIHDIARAAYLLAALEEGVDLGYQFLCMHQTQSGAALLFRRAGFLWGGLPYPGEHAEMAMLLSRIAEFYDTSYEQVQKMIAFQHALFSHERNIFPALWSQEGSRSNQEKTAVSKLLFCQKEARIEDQFTLTDMSLGFWMRRTPSFSAYVSGSGCKSGVGAFLMGDVGVLNYGPCVGDPGECLGFGLCGQVKEFSCQEKDEEVSISFAGALSQPSSRRTGFSYLQDALFSTNSCYRIDITEQKCHVASSLDRENQDAFFAIFCKGSQCQVCNGPKLRTGSPDSYKGPAYDVLIKGEKETVRILSSSPHMEIFSLQGKDRFWGSNFLINLPYTQNSINILFEKA